MPRVGGRTIRCGLKGRADVGTAPGQRSVIPKPRPTAWVWEMIRGCGLKGRDTIDVESVQGPLSRPVGAPVR